MYFRILAIIALFFITGCSNNPVSTTTQKQEITNLVKHDISIETLSGSNISIYSQGNTELLYETQTNSSGEFTIDTKIIDQKRKDQNVTNKLVLVIVTEDTQQHNLGLGEDFDKSFNRKIPFILPYENLKQHNDYSFSIANKFISEVASITSDDMYERYNNITKTMGEAKEIGKNGEHIYLFRGNIYPIRVEETNSGIILHKYLERNSIYYGTGEHIPDMQMLPNNYITDQVLKVHPNEPIFFQECMTNDINTCMGPGRQTYPFEDLMPNGYIIIRGDGESESITSEQLDALEESGQIQKMR